MHSDHNHAPFLVLPGHPQHNLDLLSKKTKSNKKQTKKETAEILYFNYIISGAAVFGCPHYRIVIFL